MSTTKNRPNHITASMLHALAMCPGRWQMTRDIEPATESDDASHGTRVHALLEARAKTGSFDFSQATPEEQDDAVKCWALLEKLLAQMGVKNYLVLFCEHRFAGKTSENVEWSGQADLVLSCDEKIVVVDWKTGHLDVNPSTRNTQLQALGVLVAKHFNKKTVTLAIIAPNAPEKISSHEMDAKEIAATTQWIESIIHSAVKPDAPLRPGEPQCRYCPAKGTCPELAKWAIEPAAKRVIVTGEKLSRDQARDIARRLSDEQVIEIWSRKQAVQWVYDAIEERLQGLTDEQLNALGLERVPGRVMRSVRDVREVFNRLKTQFAVTAAEFAAICSVPIGKLEELLTIGRGMAKADAKRAVDAILDGLCDEKQAKPTIKIKNQ